MTDVTYQGQTLYHYTDIDGLLGILKNRVIWATEIKDLADETEFEYGRDLVAHGFEAAAQDEQKEHLSARLQKCACCTR